MPTYEYACRDCGEHLEVVQSFSDAPLRVCGACGGTLRKVFSAAGIIFKGSGYYVTDTRAKAGSSESGSSSSESSGGSSSGEGGSSASTSSSSAGSREGGSTSGSGGAKSGSGEAKSA